ncbi:MAG: hypothetical protein L3J81_05585, partial [Thermoplasmata archaeon]|nr:hypothetical protein [Thermoplasmata archaeon]
MSRRTPVAPAAVVLGLLLASGLAAATNPSAGVTVGTNGDVNVALSIVDPNGSALRYAMDGNFTAIVDLLPGNVSSHAALYAELEGAESSPFLAGLFGNRDGTVEPGEVSMFEDLLRSETGTRPSTLFTGTGFLSMSLNGNPPGSGQITGITFLGGPGPDTSTAPVTVITSLSEQFLPTGTSGTLAINWNLSLGSLFGGLAVPGPNVSASVT